MKRPCAKCPFVRGSVFDGSMNRARREEIVDSINAGYAFVCHETIEDLGGPKNAQRWCAGALKTLGRQGGTWSNKMARFSILIGHTPHPDEIEADVHENFDEWIAMAPDVRLES